jgi:hypothetical protein
MRPPLQPLTLTLLGCVLLTQGASLVANLDDSLPLVYDELRKLAAAWLAQENLLPKNLCFCPSASGQAGVMCSYPRGRKWNVRLGDADPRGRCPPEYSMACGPIGSPSCSMRGCC